VLVYQHLGLTSIVERSKAVVLIIEHARGCRLLYPLTPMVCGAKSLPSHHVHQGPSGTTSYPRPCCICLICSAQDNFSSYQRAQDVSVTTSAANDDKGIEGDKLQMNTRSRFDHTKEVRARARTLYRVFMLRGIWFCATTIMVHTLQPFIPASRLMLSSFFCQRCWRRSYMRLSWSLRYLTR
jgi:hypothetical protein